MIHSGFLLKKKKLNGDGSALFHCINRQKAHGCHGSFRMDTQGNFTVLRQHSRHAPDQNAAEVRLWFLFNIDFFFLNIKTCCSKDRFNITLTTYREFIFQAEFRRNELRKAARQNVTGTPRNLITDQLKSANGPVLSLMGKFFKIVFHIWSDFLWMNLYFIIVIIPF